MQAEKPANASIKNDAGKNGKKRGGLFIMFPYKSN